MIEFYSENNFTFSKAEIAKEWIASVIKTEGFDLGEITYVFCDDDYLLKLNVEFLDHDTLTDILSFDYSLGKELNGEIYVSTERVEDNARGLDVSFEEELHRVIIHGILHYCGHKDATEDEKLAMRKLEEKYLELLFE